MQYYGQPAMSGGGGMDPRMMGMMGQGGMRNQGGGMNMAQPGMGMGQNGMGMSQSGLGMGMGGVPYGQAYTRLVRFSLKGN